MHLDFSRPRCYEKRTVVFCQPNTGVTVTPLEDLCLRPILFWKGLKRISVNIVPQHGKARSASIFRWFCLNPRWPGARTRDSIR